MDGDERDASRRTRLAAERTWLAWWRTGLAVAVAALGVGRVAPQVLNNSRTAYAAVGVGYGVLAVAIFTASHLRYRGTRAALREGDYSELSLRWVAAFAVAGVALTLATVVLIVV